MRTYTVQFNAVAVTGAQDLIEIVGHASRVAKIIAFGISQYTDVGDAAEELMSILLKSGQTTSGSGGSSYTPVPLDFANTVAAGFTAEINNTTKAGTGTIVTHYATAWNVRSPLDIILPEPMQIILPAGRRATLELLGAPADSLTMNGYMVVEEIG